MSVSGVVTAKARVSVGSHAGAQNWCVELGLGPGLELVFGSRLRLVLLFDTTPEHKKGWLGSGLGLGLVLQLGLELRLGLGLGLGLRLVCACLCVCGGWAQCEG